MAAPEGQSGAGDLLYVVVGLGVAEHGADAVCDVSHELHRDSVTAAPDVVEIEQRRGGEHAAADPRADVRGGDWAMWIVRHLRFGQRHAEDIVNAAARGAAGGRESRHHQCQPALVGQQRIDRGRDRSAQRAVDTQADQIRCVAEPTVGDGQPGCCLAPGKLTRVQVDHVGAEMGVARQALALQQGSGGVGAGQVVGQDAEPHGAPPAVRGEGFAVGGGQHAARGMSGDRTSRGARYGGTLQVRMAGS